ncbi:unnamed protein product [Polarella glacialis]|uniref:Uncharacterized protein n=3 Tax=Polarella glacialis TaxID=89957 RepID=A0A813GTW1_POLGL|nr:unnamed protein product [Polarella glacialis]CAE8657350.1 unnamed protein product [Polarella glacialis]
MSRNRVAALVPALCFCLPVAVMPNKHNGDRVLHVKSLRLFASQYGVDRVADNAARDKVVALADAVLAVTTITTEDAQAVQLAKEGYDGTWTVPDSDPAAHTEKLPTKEKVVEWYFSAVQCTYNGSEGEWLSKDPPVLEGLWRRFVAFVQALGRTLKAIGISATMEQSLDTDTHVHFHSYMHFSQPFHRKGTEALQPFAFEGTCPHVKPNKASGKDFAGAIRNGHWYVVAPKIGSLKQWSNFEPWKAYAVEGWWLDNMLKAGKLTRDTYLELAAKVNIGFQKRLMDVRASERYEKELAVHAAIAAEEAKLQAQLLPMNDFAEVDLSVSYFDGEARFRRPLRPVEILLRPC